MKNKSGITPFIDRCLIYIEPVPEKSGSIHRPQQTIDREKDAQTEAILVESGPLAFADIMATDPETVPKPGDTILIAKYEGLIYTGDDDKEYRIINSDSIIGMKGTKK